MNKRIVCVFEENFQFEKIRKKFMMIITLQLLTKNSLLAFDFLK